MFFRLPPAALILSCAILWSMAGVMIKSVEMSGLAIAGMRSLFAATAIGALFHQTMKVPTKLQAVGALSYALTVVSFVVATKMTSAANAIFLQSTAPLYVFFFTWFFLKQSPTRIDWLVMPLIVIGMSLFFSGPLDWSNKLGVIIGAASGCFFGSFLILMRKESTGSPLRAIFWGNILTFSATLPFMQSSEFNSHSLMMLTLMGLFQLALPYYIYSRAVGHISALDASLILLLEPILNPIWVFLFVGERPPATSILGGIIVIGAVALRPILRGQRSHPTLN